MESEEIYTKRTLEEITKKWWAIVKNGEIDTAIEWIKTGYMKKVEKILLTKEGNFVDWVYEEYKKGNANFSNILLSIIENKYNCFNENDMLIGETCVNCGKIDFIKITKTQYSQFKNKTNLIQRIFPELSADEREFFLLSHICGVCWDKLFEEENDKEEMREYYEEDWPIGSLRDKDDEDDSENDCPF